MNWLYKKNDFTVLFFKVSYIAVNNNLSHH